MATVVISGASRGIGLELANQHVAAGDRVFAMCRTPGSAKALADLVAANPDRVSVHGIDVRDDTSAKAAANEIAADRIDILYNIAGVTGTIAPELESVDWAIFDDALEVMLKGPLRVLQAFLPRLGEGSKVVNLTSQLAASTWPYGGFYGYVVAKAGLNRLMRSVAIDIKDRGIIVALIHPGWVQTDMGGPGADITPADSARGVREVTTAWTLAETGEFKKWTGEPHPW